LREDEEDGKILRASRDARPDDAQNFRIASDHDEFRPGFPKGATIKDVFLNIKSTAEEIVLRYPAIPRNRRISAAYADVYLGNARMKWAGIAAFASKQAGCAMHQAFGLPRWHLAKGNVAVFRDIYPAIRLYADFADSNRAGVLAALKTGNHAEDPIHDALAPIPPGSNPDSEDCWTAGVKLAKHEQETTLQREVYDSWIFKTMLRIGRLPPVSHFFPIFLSFGTSCGRLDGRRTVAFKGRLEDSDDRVAFAQEVLFRFRELTGAAATNIMVVKELEAIEALAS
jgi:hypothetical protein